MLILAGILASVVRDQSAIQDQVVVVTLLFLFERTVGSTLQLSIIVGTIGCSATRQDWDTRDGGALVRYKD